MQKPFLFPVAIAILTIFCALGRAPQAAEDALRPNIVVMLTDDQRWDAIGAVQRSVKGRFGFFSQSTPNIDRLAAQGVWFTNAFVTESLCSPSRAAFLTGRYNHNNGVVNNSTPLPINTQTYATILRSSGYHTGYFGKWHMGSQRERPGFDEYASFVGQGEYFNTPFLVNGITTPTKNWVDDVTTDYAVHFITNNSHKANPFLIVIGFKTPHGPWTPPARTQRLFLTQQIDTPPNATSYPPYFKNPKPSTFGGEAFRNYFRTIAGMDQDVGRILNTIDAERISNNTLVVFASDNGWHMREHGSLSPVERDGEKRSAYEASMRIPLFIRYPPLVAGGRKIGSAILNIDLAPTLLQIAGLQPTPNMQGKSLLPLLNQTAASVHPWVFYEYFREQGFIVPRVISLRKDGLKIIEYPDHPEYGYELYNIIADPWETNNRFLDPTMQNQLQSMLLGLRSAAQQLGYHIPPRAGPQN